MQNYLKGLLIFILCSQQIQASETIENDSLISVMSYYDGLFSPFQDEKSGVLKIKNKFKEFANEEDFIIRQIDNSELFEVVYKKQKFHTTPNIDYLILGKKISLKNNVLSKMYTNKNKAEINRALLRLYTYDDMIIHKPMIEKIGNVFVFVDYSCPYCRKFHKNNLLNLTRFGYQVNYIPFLKNPKNEKVNKKMIELFCLKDNELKVSLINEAFESPNSFQLKNIKSCEREVYIKNLLTLTNYFDFKGTPTILLYNGKQVEGFVPFNNLILELEGNR